MTVFAVLQNTQITNVIVADTQEIAEMVTGFDCVEIPEGLHAGIGWVYKDNKFIAPLGQGIETENSVV